MNDGNAKKEKKIQTINTTIALSNNLHNSLTYKSNIYLYHIDLSSPLEEEKGIKFLLLFLLIAIRK